MHKTKAFFTKHSHKLFTASVRVKLAIAIAEIIAGLAFLFLSYSTMSTILTSVIRVFVHNPQSVIWRLMDSGFRDLVVYSTSFWAFIFLSHGITKILLTRGLLRDKTWAYIFSLIIFSYFIVNQIYQAIQNPSLALDLITVFDCGVVFLIFYEYRQRVARRTKAAGEV